MVKKQPLDEVDRLIISWHKEYSTREIADKLAPQGHALEDPQVYKRIQKLVKNGVIKKQDLVPGSREKRHDSKAYLTSGGKKEQGVRVSPHPTVQFHGSRGRISRGRRH